MNAANRCKLANKTSHEVLYQRRIQLWKDCETDEPKDEVLDEPKDEVLDNRLTQVPDAVNRIKSLLIGKKARKDVAFQRKKEYHLEMCYKRVGDKLLAEKQTHDKLSKLENENARLKEELQNLTIKCHIDYIQHTRQIHHLRTKGKLI